MFLTSQEIERLTGKKRPSAQVRWLLDKGYRIEVNGLGKPVVHETEAENRGAFGRHGRASLNFQDGEIHDDAWNPPIVKLLTLPQIRALPRVDDRARRPGVYFLFIDEHVHYIGSSLNVRARATAHQEERRILFDKATYLATPWPWHLSIEAIYIRAYKPPFNRQFLE
jgi:hypothetical protein